MFQQFSATISKPIRLKNKQQQSKKQRMTIQIELKKEERGKSKLIFRMQVQPRNQQHLTHVYSLNVTCIEARKQGAILMFLALTRFIQHFKLPLKKSAL